MKKKMKKIAALLLVLCMALSMAGCSGKDNGPDLSLLPQHDSRAGKEEQANNSSKQETGEESAETTGEASGETGGEGSEESSEAADEDRFVTTYWSAVIPESLHIDEDSSYDGTWWSNYHIKNEDESIDIIISVDIDSDTMTYRKNLMGYGFSLEDQLANNFNFRTIGGMDFIIHPITWYGEPAEEYVGRLSDSHTTITVEVGGTANDDTEALVNSLKFTVPAGTLEEAPWPWDGAPFVTAPTTSTIGDFKVEVAQLVANESFLPMGIFDNQVAAADGIVYILSDSTLNLYSQSGTNLTLTQSVDLGGDYSNLCIDKNGNVYVSGFLRETLVYQKGEQVTKYAIKESAVFSPNGDEAWSWFINPDKVGYHTIDANGWTDVADVTFPMEQCKTISTMFVTDNYIVVAGAAQEDSKHRLFLYDFATGEFVMELNDTMQYGLGSVTGFAETDDYFMAVDANSRMLVFWTKDGTEIGYLEDSDLFGTNYPWMGSLCKAADGSFYISLVERRPDGSWDELVVYQMTITKN